MSCCIGLLHTSMPWLVAPRELLAPREHMLEKPPFPQFAEAVFDALSCIEHATGMRPAVAGAAPVVHPATNRAFPTTDASQKAVFDALSFMENAIEVSPVAAEALALRTPILRWLLARIKAKGEADSNKQSAAELLAILVQARALHLLLGGAIANMPSCVKS